MLARGHVTSMKLFLLTQVEAAAGGGGSAVQRTPEYIAGPLRPGGLEGRAHQQPGRRSKEDYVAPPGGTSSAGGKRSAIRMLKSENSWRLLAEHLLAEH